MRAHLRELITGVNAATGALSPLAAASVHVYQAGTTTPVDQTLYVAPSGVAAWPNPMTADANGVVEFWTDLEEVVDLLVSAAGFGTMTIESVALTASPSLAQQSIGDPPGISAQRFADSTTTERWIQAKFLVTAFGAMADGVTDAAAAIQTAIAAAHAAGGGTVVLGAGVYVIDGTLTLQDKVTLRGVGVDATILQATDVAGSIVLAQQLPSVTVALAGNIVIGARTATLAGGGGASFAAGQQVLIQDAVANNGQWITVIQSIAGDVLTFREASPLPFTSGSSGQVKGYGTAMLTGIAVRDMTLRAGAGTTPATTRDLLLRLNGCDAPTVERVKVQNGATSNIRVEACRDAVIKEVLSENVGTLGDGFDVLHATGTALVQCASRNNPFGIVASGSPFTRIEGCRVTGRPIFGTGVNDAASNGRAIKLQQSSPQSVVEGCTCTDSTLYGIFLSDTWECSVIGNAIFATGRANTEHGIESDSTAGAMLAHHNIIANNTIANVGGSGVVIGSQSAGAPADKTCNIVSGNVISNAGANPSILYQSSANLITGNVVTGWAGSAIQDGVNGVIDNAVVGNMIGPVGFSSAIQTRANAKTLVSGNYTGDSTDNTVTQTSDAVAQFIRDAADGSYYFLLQAGTQQNGGLKFGTNGVKVWQIDTNGVLKAVTDNSNDVGAPGALRPRNLYLAGAVATKVKAGVPADADFVGPVDGMLAVDSTDNKIYARIGGTWKGVVVA